MEEKITCDDILDYFDLFLLAPPFVLEMMAKKNSNLVSKFKSQVQSNLNNMDEEHLRKLHIILNSDVEDLQLLMAEAYQKFGKKQFKILANPKYKGFIEMNIGELKKLVD